MFPAWRGSPRTTHSWSLRENVTVGTAERYPAASWPRGRLIRSRYVAVRCGVVAGFDFDFEYDPDLELLLGVCVQAARSRARTLHVSWRTVSVDASTTRCIVDGRGRRLDLLGHALERDLPLVAEGAHHVGVPLPRRRRLGLGFADLYLRGYDMRNDSAMRLRGRGQTTYYFPP